MTTRGTEPAVAGVVLAAGSSLRMGRDKLYLGLGGEPVLRRTVRHALEAGLDPVLVVVGPEPERARDALAGLDAITVRNPDHAAGQSTSLRRGLESVPPARPAAVALLADMPFVTPAMVRAVVDRYRRSRAPLVVSRYGEVTAPPTLYDRRLFPELDGKACGRHVVRRHRDEAEVIDWPPESLADLDVEEDYRRALERVAAEGVGRAP